MAKAVKKQALGRGLSALLKDPDNDITSASDKNADKVVGTIIELDLDSIEVNPFQPRTSFNDETLQELATSIREVGVIQPITVRKKDFNTYQLVSGERRYRASKLAGLTTIPSYIRIANDHDSLTMALVENIQRQDLDPIEIALSYQRLIDEIELTQEQLSDRVGKKRSTIANYLRLLKLDPIVQTGIRDGFISMGHGRALINLPENEQQLEVYQQIVEKSLSVRNTEEIVRSLQKGDTPKEIDRPVKQLPNYVAKGIKDFSEYFGAKIDVKVSSNGKGKMIIPFSSEEDFKRLKKLIKSEE
ncbi:ParB/RepB/Spo0J family partition protein [Aquimarina sp. ERC-38]|uniref:ParB/RepB/Spo0J family partition protein n=1 Tax=Aquimarina sp. ERC-38 TaxID=2949996 RepID=UPI0022456682|nr:ParB/RepB/Spo0J family partition protein [Aquimarina sp. ERC-38]UZO79455.1 ParB/RepB/Spo0J family partition protein [Aquimarina sp. ERC-38]